MKQTAEFRSLAKQLYGLLDSRRKRNFIFILLAMALSAVLTQVTPKAIGWLTDDILLREQIQFGAILPVLGAILVVNVANQLVIIFRRLLVEDTATRTEKKARGLAIASLLKAPLSFYRNNMTGNIHGRLNRCLEGTVRMEKLLFMDFAPAIFNSLAAVVVIFTTLPAVLALPAGHPHRGRDCAAADSYPAGNPGGIAGHQSSHGRVPGGTAGRNPGDSGHRQHGGGRTPV